MRRSKTDRISLRATRRFAAMLALCTIGATGLTACGAVIADMPLVGLPKDAPPRKQRGTFLPVNDLPPPRETAKIETPEQARIRAELAASRDQQAARGAEANKPSE